MIGSNITAHATNAAKNNVVQTAADNGFIIIGISIAGVIISDYPKAAPVVALVMAIACIDQYYLYKQNQQKG
jgi:hypothetical protein